MALHDLDITRGLVPIEELAADPSAVLRRIRASCRPSVVVEGGKAVAVLLSPVEYQRMVDEIQTDELIRGGEREIDAGLGVDGDAVLAWIESWGTTNEPPPPVPRR